jgi:hypothetical protein
MCVLLESNFKYAGNKKMKHRALTELLMNENEGKVIDFLTIDVEGAEFTLLKVLHSESSFIVSPISPNV